MKLALFILPLLALTASAQVAPYITNITVFDGQGNVTASGNFTPPMPPMDTNSTTLKVLHTPKHKAFLDSLGTPMKVSVVVRAAVTLPPMITLAWDYPFDQIPNVVFDVYHAYRLEESPPLTQFDQIPNGFMLLSSVDGYTTLGIPATAAAEFYILRARDKFRGAVSNWNVK